MRFIAQPLPRALVFSWIALVVVGCAAQTISRRDYRPSQGFVPDQATAIKIAVAVWEPIYGQTMIADEAPYKAKLSGGVWVVEGSLPAGMLGGVALAEVAKDDGRVLRVSHGK